MSLLVLLDVSKAFDSLNHDLLLRKLRKLGLKTCAASWFSSYLSSRYQRVRYEDSVWELLPLTNGVPQGSILGSVLFTIYINDLISAVTHCQAAAYVDDSQLHFKFPVSDSSSAMAAVNQDLRNISRWCAENSSLINPEKTKLVVVGSAQLLKRLPYISLSLLGKTTSPVSFAKDLGVYVDQYLNYDVHTTKTASSCMNQLVQISRIKHLLDRKTLLLLLNSFVFSKLLYCSSVWGNTSKRNLHKLQLVQNFAARVVLGLRKFDHISQGRRSLRWLDVTEKVLFNDLVLAYKCVNGLAPDNLGKYFVKRSAVYNRNTRGCNNFVIPRCRLSMGQRAFYFPVHGNGMGYLTTSRILKRLIFLSGHFLIICSI